jgi:hypothetical protein
MKTPTAILATLFLAAPFSHARGNLTPPPGVPAPVMKTLDQVEPRIPVNATTCPGNASATHIISQSGSYYLTGPLTGGSGKAGISITGTNISVTLDLRGNAMTGVSGAGSGVNVNATGSVTVRNGTLALWSEGVNMSDNVTFVLEDLVIKTSTYQGVSCLGDGVVRRVVVQGGTGAGILGSGLVNVTDCQVYDISNVISYGALTGSFVTNCQVGNITGSSPNGIYSSGGFVKNCQVRGISGGMSLAQTTGIYAQQVEDCQVQCITAAGNITGIRADHVAQCEISSLSGNSTGISAYYVSKCRVSYLDDGSSATGILCLYSVSIQDCVINNIGTSAGVGIAVDSFGATIARNKVAATGGAGISLTYSGCSVTGNHVTNADNSSVSQPPSAPIPTPMLPSDEPALPFQ